MHELIGLQATTNPIAQWISNSVFRRHDSFSDFSKLLLQSQPCVAWVQLFSAPPPEDLRVTYRLLWLAAHLEDLFLEGKSDMQRVPNRGILLMIYTPKHFAQYVIDNQENSELWGHIEDLTTILPECRMKLWETTKVNRGFSRVVLIIKVPSIFKVVISSYQGIKQCTTSWKVQVTLSALSIQPLRVFTLLGRDLPPADGCSSRQSTFPES